jgi:hypothetical protein
MGGRAVASLMRGWRVGGLGGAVGAAFSTAEGAVKGFVDARIPPKALTNYTNYALIVLLIGLFAVGTCHCPENSNPQTPLGVLFSPTLRFQVPFIQIYRHVYP